MTPNPAKWAILMALITLATAGCERRGASGAPAPEPTTESAPAPGEGEAAWSREELWDRVDELYARARDAGENVPASAKDWLREDLGRVGSWEYRVQSVEDSDDETLTAALTLLGADRWQCYFVERRAESYRLWLRRPAKSVLGAVPVRDLLRFLPLTLLSGEEG